MPVYLRQSTAVDLAIGPFLDATDGVTTETGLTLSQADVRLKKGAGAWAQVSDITAATHEENGWYEKEFDATDTNTVGRLLVAVHESGALPVWHEFWVLEEAIYDALFAASATGALPVSAGGIAAAAFAAGAIDASAIATDAIGAAELADGAITAATFAASAIDATAIAANAITDAKVAADVTIASVTGAVGSVTGAVGSVTGNVGGNVTGSIGSVAAGGITASSIAADAIGASELAADAITEIQSGLATAVALTAVDDLIDTEVAAIKTVVDAVQAKTDNLPSDPADASVIAAAFAVTDGLITTVDTVVDSIQADTNDLQTRVPAALVSGRIDASVGAMAADVISASALSAGAVDEILDDTIGDGTLTVRQAIRVLIAGMAGKLSGAATTTITIRNAADSANVIVATVDADGNRSAVTVTP